MSPSAILDRLSDALRGKDGKFPEIFHILADSKGTNSASQIWLEAAKTALGKGELERCKRVLEAYLEQDPRNSAACMLLSNACQQLGDVEDLHESIELARSAVAHASKPDETMRASVQLAVSLGTRARAHTRPEVERQRDRAEGIQLLSNLDTLAASTTVTSSPSPPLSPGPDSPGSSSDGAGLLAARAHYTLAVLQAEQGQPQAAMASVRAALRLAQAAGAPQLTALSLALIAMLLSSRRQSKLALSVLSAAPSSSSSSSSASSTAAATAAGDESQVPAEAAAAPALWSDVVVGRLRARLLSAQADRAGSLGALAQCKRLLSGWVERRAPLPAGVSRTAAEEALVQVWCELGEALAASGQRAEALAAIDHALALRSWTAATRHALGVVHEALGQYDEAAVSYNEALALDPTHAPTLLHQGALHARRGSSPDLAVARDLLAEALRYDPACAAGWYQLGRVAAAQQHRAEAEGLLLTAVQLAGAAPALEYRELPLEPPGV